MTGSLDRVTLGAVALVAGVGEALVALAGALSVYANYLDNAARMGPLMPPAIRTEMTVNFAAGVSHRLVDLLAFAAVAAAGTALVRARPSRGWALGAFIVWAVNRVSELVTVGGPAGPRLAPWFILSGQLLVAGAQLLVGAAFLYLALAADRPGEPRTAAFPVDAP